MQQVMREVSKFLLRRVAPDRTVLVGIDGGAGSGKTTFTRYLVEILGETGTTVGTVHLDLFCRPRCERATPDCSLAVVADTDWQRLREQVLHSLHSDKRARFRPYDWVADRLARHVEISPGGVAILDGITSLRAELRRHYDLCVCLSCPCSPCRDLRFWFAEAP